MAEPFRIGLFEAHAEAAALVADKPAVSREVFDGLIPELRARAICITGLEGLATVERIQEEIAAYTMGQRDGDPVTWDQAKTRIVSILDEAHFGAEAANRRAVLLLRTHGFQAYQAANWRVAQEDADTTHLQYLATEDSRVRDSHLALNGIILRKDDPFWGKHFPPWDWGCRCRVRPMNPDQVEAERESDSQRRPEDQLVLDGPALARLRDGQIIRGELRDRDGRTVGMGSHDVTAPSDKRSEGQPWQWHPDNLRLRPEDLASRYEPSAWEQFRRWAATAMIAARTSVWDWVTGANLP